MLPDRLQLHASTTHNRHEMMTRVNDALRDGGAWLLEARMFSNMSTNFIFEIAIENLPRLEKALQIDGLELTEESRRLLKACAEEKERILEQEARFRELPGTFQLTFIHNDPDLRIEVPAVPG